jgi:hypothetical protein
MLVIGKQTQGSMFLLAFVEDLQVRRHADF